jgi:UDPglucose 6-dehydrogenase
MKKPQRSKKPQIGFIGQGWVGKNYSDDFEKRGYEVIRYSLEVPYVYNKEKIAECDIVFIAVPTPTTPQGFSDKIIDAVLPLVGKGKVAVLKSTLLPGRTKAFQDKYKDIVILNSPEFLSRKTAVHDAAHPERNIIGMTIDSREQKEAAQRVLSILPQSQFDIICTSEESEFIKYAHNVNGYIQVVFSNLLFDLSHSLKLNWSTLAKAFKADPPVSTP